MDINTVSSLVITILGSSVITLLLSSYLLDPMKEKRKYIFDEKKRVYESIIVFAQIVLYPKEAKYSLGVQRYDIQSLSEKACVENALSDLKMAIPKLMLITKNKKVVESTRAFIHSSNEQHFFQLVDMLRNDLYKYNH